jgi:hypothetical protein
MARTVWATRSAVAVDPAARRTIAQDHVRELVLDEQRRNAPESDWVATEVGAAMYAGEMAEMAEMAQSTTATLICGRCRP